MADLNYQQRKKRWEQHRREQQRQQDKERQRLEKNNIINLPAEIICEIAKYDMGHTLRLGLTCKKFNEILKEKIDENKRIAKKNEELQKEMQKLNKSAIKLYFKSSTLYRDDIHKIGKEIDKIREGLKCVNCHKEKYVYNNLCEDCAKKLSINNFWEAPNQFLLFLTNDESDAEASTLSGHDEEDE